MRRTMSHAQLIQAVRNLLSEFSHPDEFLRRYDAALASASDHPLKRLFTSLNSALAGKGPMKPTVPLSLKAVVL